MKEKLEEKKLLRKGELAQLADVRLSTIQHYTLLGILPPAQQGRHEGQVPGGSRGLNRYYDPKFSLTRLEKIKQLREKGLSLPQIVEHFLK